MKKSKFTEEQIATRSARSRADPPADVCRQLGVSEATFYTMLLHKEQKVGSSDGQRICLSVVHKWFTR